MLNNTFAKAETWDCVLLLDEADVFLAQRTRTDLKRNAIVSVFLRVLEYYKGILILTTNRVGAFEEAFKSRIHLHLYYPALNRDQTLAIWKMNLDRVINRKQGRVVADEREVLRFAEAHFKHHEKSNTRWNGRQIKNAFQTALAMAEYETLEAAGLEEASEQCAALDNTKSQLKVAHFETVAEASTQFDRYIEETIGSTDAENAFTDRDRADHFRWMVPSNTQAHQYQAHQYNAQWPYGSQGAPDPYAQPRPDSFSTSARVRPNEFHTPQDSPYQQSHAWPGLRQTGHERGPILRQSAQELDSSHPPICHESVRQVWKNAPDNGDYRSSDSGYPHSVDVRSLASPSHRLTSHMPVTLGASQHQNEDGW